MQQNNRYCREMLMEMMQADVDKNMYNQHIEEIKELRNKAEQEWSKIEVKHRYPLIPSDCFYPEPKDDETINLRLGYQDHLNKEKDWFRNLPTSTSITREVTIEELAEIYNAKDIEDIKMIINNATERESSKNKGLEKHLLGNMEMYITPQPNINLKDEK